MKRILEFHGNSVEQSAPNFSRELLLTTCGAGARKEGDMKRMQRQMTVSKLSQASCFTHFSSLCSLCTDVPGAKEISQTEHPSGYRDVTVTITNYVRCIYIHFSVFNIIRQCFRNKNVFPSPNWLQSPPKLLSNVYRRSCLSEAWI